MSRVAVVTDSTAYLPVEWLAPNQITVVPVQVIVGGKAHDEGSGVTPLEVADAMRKGVSVSTSRPTPSAFLNAYRALAESGFEAIVSIHLSSELSSTYDSALMAARQSPIPVEVVDSRSVAMGLGYAVVDAARAARVGEGSADGEGPPKLAAAVSGSEEVGAGQRAVTIAQVARASAERNRVLFYVDTLEYLRRGGRIGSAQRIIGQALAVKPLLHVVAGRVEPLEKVRTRGRALTRLLDLAVEMAADRPCRIAVQHLDAALSADEMAVRLQERIRGADLMVGEVGAVVGTHVGPGMISVILSPADDNSE